MGDLASTVTLTAALGLAGFAVLMAVAMLIVEPRPVPGGITPSRQGAETALYVAAFGLVLPLALYAGPRVCRAIGRGPNADGLPALAGFLAALLMAVVIMVRASGAFSWGGGFAALLVGLTGWWIAAAVSMRRSAEDRQWPALRKVARYAPWIWRAAAALTFGAVITVTHIGSLNIVPLVVGLPMVAAVLFAYASGRRLPTVGRRWRLAADALVVVALALAIPDLVIVTPEATGLDFAERFADLTVAFHQEFLLGPSNQVLGGGAMLVDTSSQYGVGSIYFIAGWFELFPIGYGTLGLLDGVLTALYFVVGFLILRISRVSWLLARSAWP